MTYEELKDWVAEHKDKLVLIAGFVVTFVVGFGTGHFVPQSIPQQSVQKNYTTNTAKQPTTQAAGQVQGAATTTAAKSPVQASSTTIASGACYIKGNIGSGGKKIYHVPGGAFYDRTKPEQCFNTEAEAVAAGFVKSSR